MSDPPSLDPFPPRPHSRPTDEFQSSSSSTTNESLLAEQVSSLSIGPPASEQLSLPDTQLLSSPSSYAPSDLQPSPLAPSQNHDLPAIPPASPDPSMNSSSVISSAFPPTFESSYPATASSSSFGDYSTPSGSSQTVPAPPPLFHHSSSSQSTTSASNHANSTSSGGGIGIGIGTRTANGSAVFTGNYAREEPTTSAAAVPVEFDEGVLRALCDLDVSHSRLLAFLALFPDFFRKKKLRSKREK